MYTKSKFVDAYTWSYGCTKKEAEKVYKTATESYIKAVIDLYRNQCRLAFYND